MQKYLLMIVTILFVCTGMAFATEDDSDSGDSGGHDPFTCEENDEGVETCYCSGESDCKEMQDSGVCDVPMPELGSNATGNDTSCDRNFGGVGEHVCQCSAELTGPEVSRRPDRFDPATENAPREPSVRDHRRTRRDTTSTDDIVSPGSRTTNRDNEVVRSRRGTAPAQEPIVEDGEEDETPQSPRRRDHRR